jgi:hypothetical protein
MSTMFMATTPGSLDRYTAISGAPLAPLRFDRVGV